MALLVVLFAAWRVSRTWRVFSPTADEPSHLAAGIEILDRGEATYDRLHPPLARVAVALGPYLAGARSCSRSEALSEGRCILYESGLGHEQILVLARAGILPFFVLGALGVWILARRLHDSPTAFVAVTLYAHLPPVLAHAGLATTDMASATALVVAFALFELWWERRSVGHSALLGLGLGLVVATKGSGLPFLLLGCAAFGLVSRLRHDRASGPRRPSAAAGRWRATAAALACFAVAFGVVWGAYGFGLETLAHKRQRPYAQIDAVLGDAGALHDLAYGLVELPMVPASVRGVHESFRSLAERAGAGARPSFLLGEMHPRGSWAYFPVALAVKTPLPFLVLLLVGSVAILRRVRSGGRIRLVLPLLASAAVLGPSLFAAVNIGVRHVLAVYPLLSVPAAAGALAIWRRGLSARSLPRWIFAGLLLWQIVSVQLAHPHWLAWFNPPAAEAPERILNDSNLDWGQDLDRLAAELKRRGVGRLHLAYFGSAEPARHGLPPFEVLRPDERVEGWVAVSLFSARELYLRSGPVGPYAWLADHRPVARIGRSIDLYHILSRPPPDAPPDEEGAQDTDGIDTIPLDNNDDSGGQS